MLIRGSRQQHPSSRFRYLLLLRIVVWFGVVLRLLSHPTSPRHHIILLLHLRSVVAGRLQRAFPSCERVSAAANPATACSPLRSGAGAWRLGMGWSGRAAGCVQVVGLG